MARDCQLNDRLFVRSLLCGLVFSCLFAPPLFAQTNVIVPRGAIWKYVDDGVNRTDAWTILGYDDSGWTNGFAPLGYNEPGVIITTTTVGRQVNYFRHTFQLLSLPAGSNLSFRVWRDDAAKVFLNGQVLLADSNRNAKWTPPHEGFVPTSALRIGSNTVAAEVRQANTFSSDLVFDFELFETNGSSVQPARVDLSSPPNGTTVRVGTTENNLDQSVEDVSAVTEHEVQLTGLTPGTKYWYEIGTTGGRLASGYDYFFVTSPAFPKPTRIWALGDSGTASTGAGAVASAYQNFTGTRHTDLWLMLGDNAYGGGSDSEYQRAVFDFYPQLLRQFVLWPTLGNHDASSAYYNIFTLPTQGEAGGVPSGKNAPTSA